MCEKQPVFNAFSGLRDGRERKKPWRAANSLRFAKTREI
jgi:hypothetical protein